MRSQEWQVFGMNRMSRAESVKQMVMNISERNANATFIEIAMSAGTHLANQGVPFTSADIRDLMEKKFPTLSTHDDRALGAVMRKLSSNGTIRPTGRYVNSKRTRNHNRPLREWEGTKGQNAQKEKDRIHG